MKRNAQETSWANRVGGADIGQRWVPALQASAPWVRTAFAQCSRPVMTALDQPLSAADSHEGPSEALRPLTH